MGSNALTITSERRTLSSEDIKKMLDEAKEFEAEDKKFAKVTVKKVELRSELSTILKYMEDEKNVSKIQPESRVNEFKAYLNDLDFWLDHGACDDVDVYVQKIQELKQKFNEVLANPTDSSAKTNEKNND